MSYQTALETMGAAIEGVVLPLVERNELIAAAVTADQVLAATYFMFYDSDGWKYIAADQLEVFFRHKKQKTYESVLSTTNEITTLALTESIADIQAISIFIKTATNLVPPGLTGPSYAYNFIVANQLLTIQMENTALATLGGGTLTVTITKR